MRVKIVDTPLTTNSAGQVVEALPVLPTEDRYHLIDELEAGDVAPYVMIPPLNKITSREAGIAARYFAAYIFGLNAFPAMPRETVGVCNAVGHWRALPAYGGDNNTGANMIAKVDATITRQNWQVFTFHDVLTTGAGTAVAIAEFEALLAYLDAERANIDVVTITEAVGRMRGV
jgi:hypothetical protein